MKQNRQKQILVAAVATLTDAGCASFSMRSVAKRVGIQLSAVQYYFPTKRHLLEAALEAYLEQYYAEINLLISRQDLTPTDKLEAITNHMLTTSMDRSGGGFFLSLWSTDQYDENVGELLNQFSRESVRRISNLIGLAHPGLSKDECLDRAIAIASMILGAPKFIGPSKQYANRANPMVGRMLAMAMDIAGTDGVKDGHVDDGAALINQ